VLQSVEEYVTKDGQIKGDFTKSVKFKELTSTLNESQSERMKTFVVETQERYASENLGNFNKSYGKTLGQFARLYQRIQNEIIILKALKEIESYGDIPITTCQNLSSLELLRPLDIYTTRLVREGKLTSDDQIQIQSYDKALSQIKSLQGRGLMGVYTGNVMIGNIL
jgi:hypothetical protein